MQPLEAFVEEVQEAEERDQRCALKEPLEELCTGGILECVFDVQLERDVLRVRFEDKLREAAGGEAAVGAANAILKPVLGERVTALLHVSMLQQTASLVTTVPPAGSRPQLWEGQQASWPACSLAHAPAAHRRGQGRRFLDCFATSVVVHEHHHEFSRPSPDVGGGAVRDGPRGFLEGAVRELQASGSARRDRRKLEPAGLWVKRDQLLDNLRCGIEDAITRAAALQGLDRFLGQA